MKFENRRHDRNESQSLVKYSEQSHTSDFVALQFLFNTIYEKRFTQKALNILKGKTYKLSWVF